MSNTFQSPVQRRRRTRLRNTSSPYSSPRSERKSPLRNTCGDRFIASRRVLDMEVAHYNLTSPNKKVTKTQQDTTTENPMRSPLYQSRLQKSIFASSSPKVLNFKENNKRVPLHHSPYSALYSPPVDSSPSSRTIRKLPTKEEKILDAPEIADDFYLNLLDWSPKNIIAVALSSSVYLWNARNGAIQHLCETDEPEDMITSLSFSQDGSYLAVGTRMAEVQIWDVQESKLLRGMSGHLHRVGALSWNQSLISSGSRDSFVLSHDPRIARNVIMKYKNHTQEVCGLRWSPDGTRLASGGNDNILNIWTPTDDRPLHRLDEHQAAVKAIAWCPWKQNLLATGGGTADRKIKFWNTSTGVCEKTVDTKSQVCAIQWCKHHKELISSHGFSENQLIVWKYPCMTKIGELKGHESRVLHMAQSPDGMQIVTAAADDTMRFWRPFEPASKRKVRQRRSGLNVRRGVHMMTLR